MSTADVLRVATATDPTLGLAASRNTCVPCRAQGRPAVLRGLGQHLRVGQQFHAVAVGQSQIEQQDVGLLHRCRRASHSLCVTATVYFSLAISSRIAKAGSTSTSTIKAWGRWLRSFTNLPSIVVQTWFCSCSRRSQWQCLRVPPRRSGQHGLTWPASATFQPPLQNLRQSLLCGLCLPFRRAAFRALVGAPGTRHQA